jgi:hypothetical protein
MAGVQFDPTLCRDLLADAKWAEMQLEVEIAAREFPAVPITDPDTAGSALRHSSEFRAT